MNRWFLKALQPRLQFWRHQSVLPDPIRSSPAPHPPLLYLRALPKSQTGWTACTVMENLLILCLGQQKQQYALQPHREDWHPQGLLLLWRTSLLHRVLHPISVGVLLWHQLKMTLIPFTLRLDHAMPRCHPNRCQSSSSLIDQTGKEKGRGPSNQVWGVNENESSTHMLRQHSLPDCPVQGTSDLSASCDITLRDSQQILVLNRNVPLNAQSATENYLANFKDTGDDDDDYAEIRSEDEETAQLHNQPGTAVNYCNPPEGSMQTLVKGQQVSTDPETALQGYTWSDPDCSQQGVNPSTIVQSLRGKLQCLSSSSFA